MEHSTISEYVQDKINWYVSQKKHQSLMVLSDKSGVPYNTVRRLSYGKVERPSLETVFSLLKTIESRSDLASVMSRFYPGLGAILAVDSQNPAASVDFLVHLLKDPVTCAIYQLASQNHGVDEAYLSEAYGEDGIERVNELLNLGFLETVGTDRVKYQVCHADILDPEIIFRKILTDIENYDKGLIGSDGSFLATHTEAVSIQGLRALKKAMKELSSSVHRIMADPVYDGDLPVYLSVVQGLFDSQKFEEQDS